MKIVNAIKMEFNAFKDEVLERMKMTSEEIVGLKHEVETKGDCW